MWIVLVFILVMGITAALVSGFGNLEQAPKIGSVVGFSEKLYPATDAMVHELAVAQSQTNVPVLVLSVGTPIYSGILQYKAAQPGKLCEMGMSLRKNVTHAFGISKPYEFRKHFLFATVYNADPIVFELLPMLLSCRAHVLVLRSEPVPKGYRVLKHISATFSNETNSQEWQLLRCQIPAKSVYEVIYSYCDLQNYSTLFYKTSEKREDEIRKAYANDRVFDVQTTTGLIHACVLRSMFPTIRITISAESAKLQEPPFSTVLECYRKFYP